MPAVTHVNSDSRVARFAKSHKIAHIIAASTREWKNVVHLFGRRQLDLLLTFLADRVGLDVTVADALPRTAVAFVGLGVPLVLVVLFVHDLLVLGTVLLTRGEPTATGICAGTFGFVGHWFTSLRA